MRRETVTGEENARAFNALVRRNGMENYCVLYSYRHFADGRLHAALHGAFCRQIAYSAIGIRDSHFIFIAHSIAVMGSPTCAVFARGGVGVMLSGCSVAHRRLCHVRTRGGPHWQR